MLDWIVPVTDVVVALLLFLLGGNLGSFLNVVVHRLPRGESVVVGGSRCPVCRSAIRWHDNVPVLGWLLLKGRCRDCAAEIAPRYPLVEAAGALVIGGVAAVELLSGGATFPGSALAGCRSGADTLLLHPHPGLIGMAAFHAWLLFNLLLGAGVAADGGRAPRAWTIPALALSVAVVVTQDWLLPVGVGGDLWSPRAAGDWQGPVRGFLVAAVGMACGALLAPRGDVAGRRGLILVGASLGWQAAAVIALSLPVSEWCRRRLAAMIPAAPTAAAIVPELGTTDGERGQATPAERPSDAPDPGDDMGPDGASPQPLARVSVWRRLGAAACDAIRRRPSSAGDLVVATALYVVAWRAAVAIWP